MKDDFRVLNFHRIETGPLASDDTLGRSGAFRLHFNGADLTVIATDQTQTPTGANGDRWEHVSIRARGRDMAERTPTWAEVSWVRSMFFDPPELVMMLPTIPDNPQIFDWAKPMTVHLWHCVSKILPPPPPSDHHSAAHTFTPKIDVANAVCKHGHNPKESDIYTTPAGERVCRLCVKESVKRVRARKRVADEQPR